MLASLTALYCCQFVPNGLLLLLIATVAIFYLLRFLMLSYGGATISRFYFMLSEVYLPMSLRIRLSLLQFMYCQLSLHTRRWYFISLLTRFLMV